MPIKLSSTKAGNPLPNLLKFRAKIKDDEGWTLKEIMSQPEFEKLSIRTIERYCLQNKLVLRRWSAEHKGLTWFMVNAKTHAKYAAQT